MPTHLRPAIFCERDGILNEWVRGAGGRLSPPLTREQLVLARQAGPFVRGLNRMGYLVLVVTSQPDMASGVLTPIRLDHLHSRLRSELARNDARLDGIFCCPHAPARIENGQRLGRPACPCRKPSPGLILEAAAVHRVDLDRSFLVGQMLEDIEAGRSAGVATILLTPHSASDGQALSEAISKRPDARPDLTARDLLEALSLITKTRERLLEEEA